MTPADSSEPDLFSQPMGDENANGYVTWQQQRTGVVNRLGQLSGLPLNHWVELTLRDGVRLKGKLRLREEKLFVEETDARGLELVIDGFEFRSTEVETCLRLD